MVLVANMNFWKYFTLCRFILRNYIAENAIKAAEKGDYSVVSESFCKPRILDMQ
jgi:hypothetical protein